MKNLSLWELAIMIKEDWVNMPAHPMPYANAMLELNSIDDSYYLDSGRSIVAYFLANAASWKGDTAKAVKAELKRRLK